MTYRFSARNNIADMICEGLQSRDVIRLIDFISNNWGLEKLTIKVTEESNK